MNLRRQSLEARKSDTSVPGGLPEAVAGIATAAQDPPRLWPKRIHRKKYGRWYR
jgi:hypothetical protein